MKIKIGQIGIGHNHGAEKMRAVRKFPELFEVVGWCEEDEEWVEKRGDLEAYKGIPRMTREELLNYPGIEAMLIETDVWRMMTAASECVKRGIHIHLDKPAGEDFAEYESIIREAECRKAIVQLGYMYRYNPAVMYILEKIRSGETGRVLMIDADMCTEHDDHFRKWLGHYKGGDMYIFGSHLIDLILLLQGEPQAVHPYLKRSMVGGIDTVDSTLAVLEYPNAVSSVRVTSIEANGYGRRQLVVVCENCSFEVKPLERPMKLFYTKKDENNAYQYHAQEIPLEEPSGRYDDMIRDLYAFIRNGKTNPYGYGYELTLHKLILQASGIL